MKITPAKLESYAFTAAVVGAGLLVLYVAARGVKGATKDIVSGVVGGAFDAVGGALEGAYEAVPDSVKPTNPNNVIYGAVNSVGSTVSGDKNFNLGTWIYDATH